jgi:hypothetical protein
MLNIVILHAHKYSLLFWVCQQLYFPCFVGFVNRQGLKYINPKNNNAVSAVPRNTSLAVDSGWNERGVSLDFTTSRGQTVTLSNEDWREFKGKVDALVEFADNKAKGCIIGLGHTYPKSVCCKALRDTQRNHKVYAKR